MSTLRWKRLLTASLAWACTQLAIADTPDGRQSWYRVLNLSAPVNPSVEAFEIVGIGSEDGKHLVGQFLFFNYKEGEKFPAPITLKGSKKADGTFWPRVIAQVTNDLQSQWTTIQSPSIPGEAISLVVTSKQEKQRFYVDLDVFRPVIGKMKYGRIVLETGDSANLFIDDLLPP